MDDDSQTERLGFLLNSAGRRVYTMTEEVLQRFALSPRDFGVLETLSQVDALNQLALAKRRRIDPATLVALIDRLEAEGYLMRVTDPADRRSRLLRLTQQGAGLTAQAGMALDAAEAEFLSVLDERDRSEFLRLLERLVHQKC